MRDPDLARHLRRPILRLLPRYARKFLSAVAPKDTKLSGSYSDRRYVKVPPKFTSCQTIVSGEVKVTRNEPPGGLAFSS